MTAPEIIAKRVSELSNKSNVELIAIQIYNSHESGEQSVITNRIAATQILQERQASAESKRHAELLDEIKKPHWSVTPSFYLLVLSVMLTAAALIVPVIALREQRSTFSNQPPQKEQSSVVGSSPSSPLPPSHSTASQLHQPQR